MTHGSLFSGIGGFDLAAEWMGWDNIFHCEWNEFGQRVLKYHFPQSISYDDITKTDFSVHRGQIDILTGGFPCQPYSSAGKRLGTEDDRHLWPDMLRTIREVQPRWVVGENVRGLVNWNDGLVFDEVQSDLEIEGFKVTPFILPACAVDAPHRRDRVWFVGYRNATDSNSKVSQRWDEGRKTEGSAIPKERTKSLDSATTTDTNSGGLEGTTEVGRNCIDVEREGIVGFASDTMRQRSQGRQDVDRWKEYDQERSRIGYDIGAISQAIGTESKRDFQNFPTKSPICGGDDGLPRELDSITFPKWRNESIKAYGNAIVPQVAFQIFQAIAAYEAG